ncbi:hypothetical protein AUEXF2481DRAFT_210323 [Aureobasidium subglaciale EXF-2481]|uniref:Uncharacterized protein n=1 Tax=Aureobasidium subglaciale (strain EXF-2481) TaxID=1043005 RepID=A0A074YBR6_AURSE|nr:uncharacterized protein AUEXF2481DRAFT_210323 [Aureobasidium subglaciale EXF-2481]KEQ95228.1 hypothetical protein AUEXF2481DRAFT_210323 [Aureobasidium subglaciale EXF-2481]
MNQPGIHTESDDVTPVPSLVEDSESSSIQHVKVKRVSSKPDGSDDNANQPIGEDCYGGPSPLDGGSRALRQSNNRSSSINEDRGTVDTYEILKNEEMPVEHFMATADKIRDCPRPSSSRRKSPFRFPAWLVHQTGKDEREEMIQEPTARDSGKHPPSSRVTAHETIEDEHPRPIEPVATGSDMRFNAVERLDHWAILHGVRPSVNTIFRRLSGNSQHKEQAGACETERSGIHRDESMSPKRCQSVRSMLARRDSVGEERN